MIRIAQTAWQQGDVFGRKLNTLPLGIQKSLGRKRIVLAEGEHTGHAHVIEDDDAELIQIGDRILLKLEKSAAVRHEEHKPITLSPGIWEIGRVREFDYFAQMERKVTD